MLEAMYEIGKIQKAANPLSEMTQEFGENYKYLFKILFRIDHEPIGCTYESISVEEIDKSKKDRYLYKRGAGANAPDVTPVSKITEPKKTFKTKLWAVSLEILSSILFPFCQFSNCYSFYKNIIYFFRFFDVFNIRINYWFAKM